VRAAMRAREKASMTGAAAWLGELGVGQCARILVRQSIIAGALLPSPATNLSCQPNFHGVLRSVAILGLMAAFEAARVLRQSIIAMVARFVVSAGRCNRPDHLS
jgi:hypothetical protein